MLKIFHLQTTFYAISLLFLSSCSSGGFDVEGFDPLANYTQKKNDSVYVIKADLSNSVLYGIEIPTAKQLPNGKFAFSFKLDNNSKPQYFYYKLYYQNESYKWNEGDSLDDENFYGSWEEADLEFKRAFVNGETTVVDSFKIIGNPRDEIMYYGADPEYGKVSDTLLAKYIARVKREADWYNSVVEKSKFNKVSINEQLYSEALWGINYKFQNDSTYNNRWKRNPRMGNYKFMLVVCNNEDLAKIPDEVRRISLKTNNKFTNPFTYFLHKDRNDLPGTKIILSQKQLSVSADLNLGSGIYANPFNIKQGKSKEYYSNSCTTSDWLYRKAQFEQYFHHINKNWEFVNIKEVRDVVEENLTREQYQNLINEYNKSKNFVHTFASAPDCPCKTVKSDSLSNSITIFNPGNENGSYKKEHVGVISRIGFTYGKWRAKIKFPKIISKDNVWNGITAAFWLIFQADEKWNLRRNCNAEIAYIPKHVPEGPESVKESQRRVTYSEIDFEILKESKYWVKSAYGNKPDYPKEDASKNNDITICCTNWDMACHEPKNFIIGAKEVDVEGYKHEFCRWDYFNKLVTAKKPAPHAEVFNDDFYYFEIDWQPKRIIWRIGKDKNNLKEICRMEGTMTSIPNNQMVMVMSQEFHYQEWWPTAPFLQNFIPFPKNNLTGKLLEVEIE
ncbi:MAG TPA: hypothetical protein VN026_03240 [Bacteroidia bacterium]|nr:hypothetical protein [Bacteroidia bacterium]